MPGIYNETGRGHNYRLLPGVWKAEVPVSPGDLVFRDSDGYDKPVSNVTWDTNIETTGAAAHDAFRGVSMVRRVASQLTDGNRSDGMIIVDGPFRFPCAALGVAGKVGDLVTFVKATGNVIENQKVAITTTQGLAIGRLIEDAPVGQTYLDFELEPALYKGGSQAIA